MIDRPRRLAKILVVDDEPDNLDLLDRVLSPTYQVLRASSGQEALQILSREPDIAVIVSDQRMPKMTGTEFLSLTAMQYPDMIRILVTAYTDVDDLVEAINSGKVFKYVTKPWHVDELRAVVRQAVDTHNVLRTRTEQLCRTLRQESLLNAVTNTIRSRTNYQQILQTIVETMGQMFEASCCILRTCDDPDVSLDAAPVQPWQWFGYAGASLPAHLKHPNGEAGQKPDLDPRLAQTLWETEEIVVMNQANQDERLLSRESVYQAYQYADIRSSVIVPLSAPLYRRPSQLHGIGVPGSGGPGEFALVAVLALHQCSGDRIWQDDEVQLVVMVAEQAALTLAQSKTLEMMQTLAQREALINTITTAIRSSLNPQDIFAAITEQLGCALQVDGCALSLWTQEDEFVECVGLYERQPEAGRAGLLPQSLVPIEGNLVLQHLLETHRTVVIPDMAAQPDWNQDYQPFHHPARALLVVPLLSDGQIIGSISLRQNGRPRAWHGQDIALAQAVAAQAAIAVQQARLYQKTRQQAERLLILDRQKTEFFQNVSHEFRTPLTLMMGPLEAAVSHGQDLPLDRAEMALRNCRRLLRLVNQLLDLQRLDEQRMQPTFVPCDLDGLVGQILQAFRPYCERKQLNLRQQLQPNIQVYLDLDLFEKVLYNLLSNAMKFTPPGGEITVSVQTQGESAQVTVQDTGIGIEGDRLQQLFDRFYQAEGSVDRTYEGSGLGLALVKELVELHGGQVQVESQVGQGSCFTVQFPLGTDHLPQKGNQKGLPPRRLRDTTMSSLREPQGSRITVEFADCAEVPPQSGTIPLAQPEINVKKTPSQFSATILFVEDNRDLRVYVAGMLQDAGYQVVLASNGEEGTLLAKSHHPDAIVTDLMMPKVSGLDLIAAIRADEDLQGIPIVLLTAKANEETRLEGVEQGADAYVSKPFNDRELLAQIRNLLALKEQERQIKDLNRYLTQSVLTRFLPPALVEKACLGELQLDLTPEPRLVTIVFTDIVGFTQMANQLRSRRVAQILNQYLSSMSQVIFQAGGTVDKFVGDAVMAIFGAPEEMKPEVQVRQAIGAAHQMYRQLDVLNTEWGSEGLTPVQFRCGIHQGTAVVGMFGSEARSDYTAIGPSVNIAARLQEVAEPGRILISAAVADYLQESEITKFRPLHLKGIDETVLAFSLNPLDNE
ncbi:response regulator [Geitlerinema sp. P-1104]|uniref:response regulator n=1 Tax=Geitlerinema sp. P-1104 TaxID=2546230 RepID=UPI001476F1DA|nr:response regulator [Geitlerinema sp. P-1104]NMG57299.1 response regulator [Geitlerinema sp. P-1104]